MLALHPIICLVQSIIHPACGVAHVIFARAVSGFFFNYLLSQHAKMTIYFTRFFVLRQQQDQTSSPPCAGLSKFLFEDTQTCEHVAALSELPTATIHLKPLKCRFPSPKRFEMCETTPHPSFKCVFISLGGFPEFFSNLFCAWTQSVPNNGLHSNKSGN